MSIPARPHPQASAAPRPGQNSPPNPRRTSCRSFLLRQHDHAQPALQARICVATALRCFSTAWRSDTPAQPSSTPQPEDRGAGDLTAFFLLRSPCAKHGLRGCPSLPLGTARRHSSRHSTQKVLVPPSFCACAPRRLRSRQGLRAAALTLAQAQNPGPSKIFPLQRA